MRWRRKGRRPGADVCPRDGLHLPGTAPAERLTHQRDLRPPGAPARRRRRGSTASPAPTRSSSRTWSATNGLFTVDLNFPFAAFNGQARWLDIRMRPGTETGAFTPMSPLQRLAAVPYALHALSGDPTILQKRVTAGCAAQSSIRTINEDGSVVCELDDGSTAGTHDHFGQSWTGNATAGLTLNNGALGDGVLGTTTGIGMAGVHGITPGRPARPAVSSRAASVFTERRRPTPTGALASRASARSSEARSKR